MRVEFTQEVEVTGTTEIGVSDITAALLECDANLASIDSMIGIQYNVMEIMGSVAQVLKSITPEIISKLDVNHRQLVVDCLRDYANLWASVTTLERCKNDPS